MAYLRWKESILVGRIHWKSTSSWSVPTADLAAAIMERPARCWNVEATKPSPVQMRGHQMHRRMAVALVLAVAAPLTAAVLAQTPAADWPQWRGADRTGISKETGLLKQWPAAGPA